MTTTETDYKVLLRTNKVIDKYPDVFKRTADIHIPDILFHPYKTGTEVLDSAFSEIGGITPSCITLITGTPGTGKTTLMGAIGARLQTNKPVVFLSYEMSDFQTKLTAKKIDGFDRIILVTDAFHTKSKEAFENFLFGPLKEMEPALVIVDSLQEMAGAMSGSFNNNQIYITDVFTRFAKETFTPINLIGHVSKDGTYKGPSTIRHKVDAHMHIELDKDSGQRMFSFSKNRFGGSGNQYPFKITSDGVYIGNESWVSDDGTMAEHLKETVKNFRKESANQHVIPFNSFKKLTIDIVEYLSMVYSGELKHNTFFKSDDIKITWKGKRAYCSYKDGRLNFGEGFMEKVSNDRHTYIGYKIERAQFKSKYCKTKEDTAIWIILHEFQHLFIGNQRHVKAFFARIEKLWIAHSDIFTAE